jgi:hypothetical protein
MGRTLPSWKYWGLRLDVRFLTQVQPYVRVSYDSQGKHWPQGVYSPLLVNKLTPGGANSILPYIGGNFTPGCQLYPLFAPSLTSGCDCVHANVGLKILSRGSNLTLGAKLLFVNTASLGLFCLSTTKLKMGEFARKQSRYPQCDIFFVRFCDELRLSTLTVLTVVYIICK